MFQQETLAGFVAKQTVPVWAMIDGANCKLLPRMIERHSGASLYKSSTKTDSGHAPWLFELQPESPILEDLELLAPDMHWGFVFSSAQSRDNLRSHFRRFTMMWVDGHEGVGNAPVYFRFYDPRVLMDCFEALLPEHLAALLQPVQRLALPLSPVMGRHCGISPLAPRSAFRDAFLSIDCPAGPVKASGHTAFRMTAQEFDRFGQAQRSRATRKLARELSQMHPQLPEELVLYSAHHAADRAGAYGLGSVQQVRLFAECMIWHGSDFDRRIPDARALLLRDDPLAWRKAAALESWFLASKNPPASVTMKGADLSP